MGGRGSRGRWGGNFSLSLCPFVDGQFPSFVPFVVEHYRLTTGAFEEMVFVQLLGLRGDLYHLLPTAGTINLGLLALSSFWQSPLRLADPLVRLTFERLQGFLESDRKIIVVPADDVTFPVFLT